jgi:hypothetical protein
MAAADECAQQMAAAEATSLAVVRRCVELMSSAAAV